MYHSLELLNWRTIQHIYVQCFSAPKAFQLQQNTKAGTVAEDPFSKDRQFNLPKGDGLDIKKSDKALTEFEDFRHKDVKLKVDF